MEETGQVSVIERPEQMHAITQSYLSKFFKLAAKYGASDLLLRGGQVPKLRIGGELRSFEADPLDPGEFEKAVEQFLSPRQWAIFSEQGSVDVGADLNEQTRFRLNIYRTRGRFALSARLINSAILSYEQLHLPPVVHDIVQAHQGLVFVCGITGCGKSTTIASMLQEINESRACHVVTIEDPIEYLFTDNKAIVSQREIGIDVPDFVTGLHALLRENPDVVLIGEMRDKETIEAALQASETGHLVFGTIHASSATQAFGRIYDLFPVEERAAVRNLLAYQMQAVIYQKLLPGLPADLQSVPAVEVLLQSPPTRKYILEGREHELEEVMRTARGAGMQTLVDSLVELVEKEYIHPRTAHSFAPNPQELQMRLRGIKT